jgi:hypothetical protein
MYSRFDINTFPLKSVLQCAVVIITTFVVMALV